MPFRANDWLPNVLSDVACSAALTIALSPTSRQTAKKDHLSKK